MTRKSHQLEAFSHDKVSAPSVEQVHQAALLARKNANRFFRDAKLLLNAGSSAHAFGMLVLAEEEIGKATAFHLYADGFLRNPQWLWLVTKKHEAKHAAMILTIMIRLILVVLIGLGPEERVSTKRKKMLKTHSAMPAGAAIYHRIRAALQDLPAIINTVADIFDELSQLGQLQDQREQMFYVGFQSDGRPTNPLSMNTATCRRHLKRVAARLDVARHLLGAPTISLKGRQKLAKVPDEMRRQLAAFEAYVFGKKGMHAILNWLEGPGPRNISDSIREFSRDEDRLARIHNELTSALKKMAKDSAS